MTEEELQKKMTNIFNTSFHLDKRSIPGMARQMAQLVFSLINKEVKIQIHEYKKSLSVKKL